MKKLLAGLLLMTSFSAFAENPFDQFLGEYAVKSEKCSDVSPYFEKLDAMKITKGIFSNRNLESTFIHFKRGGYYSESLNLSAYRRLIDYTENQGAVFSAQELKTFSIDRLDENTFSFHFFEDWGASGVDECSYVLELIR